MYTYVILIGKSALLIVHFVNLDEPAEWEDPALQAEIEAATGVSLNPSGAKGKGQKKGRQRKYPGLTNLNKLNTKTKLEKKILNP